MSEHISYSQISRYLSCGESYRRRYICGEILAPGIALIKGKSVHKGIEINSKQKIESHEDLKKADIVEQTITAYEQESTSQEIKVDQGQDAKEEIGKGKDGAASLAGLYADEVAHTIQPVKVEESITIDIPGGKPLLTIVDCIDDQNIIHDYKTSGKTKPQSEADNSLQLTIYAMAYHDKFGIMPPSLQLDNLVETKTPKYVKLSTTRDENAYIKTLRYLQSVTDGIEKEVFLPAAPGSWQCSSRFCGFYETCRYVQSNIM